MNKILTTAALATGLFLTFSVNATGIHRCEPTDRSAWLSKTELTEKLEADGWSVRHMKEDGGCWEVYGTNPEGKRVEGYFHPVTGAAELIAQRGKVLFRAGGS